MNWFHKQASNISLIGTIVLMSCCYKPGTVDQGVRYSLDLLADVVGPSSQMARQGCDAKERVAVVDVKEGKITAATAMTHVAEVRERCDAIRKSVDQIRKLHEEAVTLYEQGALEEVKHRIEDARSLYRGLVTELETP
jgi:hypothetical protein